MNILSQNTSLDKEVSHKILEVIWIWIQIRLGEGLRSPSALVISCNDRVIELPLTKIRRLLFIPFC